MNLLVSYFGSRHTVPSHPALFYALTPLGVLLLASGLRQKMAPKRKIFGVLIALVGVCVVLRPWEVGETIKELRIGDFWGLCAVLAWVVYTGLVGRTCQDHAPRVVTAWSLILGAVVMTPIGGYSLLTMDYGAIPPAAWPGLAWMVVLTSVVMMLVWNVLLSYLDPVEVPSAPMPNLLPQLSCRFRWQGPDCCPLIRTWDCSSG